MNDETKAISVNLNKARIVQERPIDSGPNGPAEFDNREKVHEIGEALLVTVRLLVDRPGDVAATIVPTVAGPVLQLRVHSTDIGKVIGKQGRTARALRSLLGSMNATAKIQMSLDIVDNQNAMRT